MKLLRLSIILPIAGAVAAGALLFWTSQNVQQAENELASLQKTVQSERQSIRVLRAEWDYLNRPDRLEALAMRHLGLYSSSAAAFSVGEDVSDLPQVMIPALPPRKPLMDPQPAVMQVPQAQSAPLPPPARPADSDAEKQSFQSLLEQLNAGEGAP